MLSELRRWCDRLSFWLACAIGYPFIAWAGLHEMRAER